MFLVLLAPTSSILPIADTLVERRVYLGSLGLVLIIAEFAARIRLGPLPRRCHRLCRASARGDDHEPQWRLCQFPGDVGGLGARQSGQQPRATPNSPTPTTSRDAARTRWQPTSGWLNWRSPMTGRCSTGDSRSSVPDKPVCGRGESQRGRRAGQPLARLDDPGHAATPSRIRLSPRSKHWTRPFRLNPGDDNAYAYRGNVRLAAGEKGLAIADFQKSLELNPANAAARRGLAVAQGR